MEVNSVTCSSEQGRCEVGEMRKGASNTGHYYESD